MISYCAWHVARHVTQVSTSERGLSNLHVPEGGVYAGGAVESFLPLIPGRFLHSGAAEVQLTGQHNCIVWRDMQTMHYPCRRCSVATHLAHDLLEQLQRSRPVAILVCQARLIELVCYLRTMQTEAVA